MTTPQYRYVRLFIVVGPACAVVCALGLLAVAAWLVVQGIIGWVWAVVLIAASAFAGFLILVLVDLARLIADMLLPR